jgi:magnesium-transporting ATPase (P-type)
MLGLPPSQGCAGRILNDAQPTHVWNFDQVLYDLRAQRRRFLCRDAAWIIQTAKHKLSIACTVKPVFRRRLDRTRLKSIRQPSNPIRSEMKSLTTLFDYVYLLSPGPAAEAQVALNPPRVEVPEAIRQAREAGIRVVMVTGDHPATAVTVANEVGIPPGRVITGLDLEKLSPAELSPAVKEANVFARVAPQDKLRLIETLKANGEIVAVTGDGVNDAPALKRSDVGVAMGQRGSDVSREVADLVLLDDNFATIVAAIKEGRNIYENIQKFIRFLFSTNLSETLIVVMGVIGSFFLGLHDETGRLLLPLTAAQLLWVNVVTDGPPALALGLDRDAGVLRQSPRDPKQPLLDSHSLRLILTTGIFKALVGGALLIGLPYLGYSLTTTRTLLFLYMTIGQLMFAYPARRIAGRPQTNIALHLAVILGTGLQLATGSGVHCHTAGLAILATEFVWARVLLKRARDMFPKTAKSKSWR